MKPDSLKELQEAVRILNYTKTDISNAAEDIDNALAHLRAALFMETPNVSEKFNLYDYTDDYDGQREVMGCVHHENGFRVASDGKLLVAVKEDYTGDMEGKNINKKGEECDRNYPKWESLFNDKQKQAESFNVDFDKIATWRKEYAAEKKMRGKKGARSAYVKIGPAFFSFDLLSRFARFMKSVSTDSIHIEASNRAASCFASDGSKGLIMPAYSTRIEYHDEPLSECWERKDDRVMMWELA